MIALIIIIIGFLTFAILESFKNPEAATMQVIMLFGKPHTVISNINGKRVNKPNKNFIREQNGKKCDKWDLVDSEKGRKFNIYFYPWPIFKTYRYTFEYTKRRKIGEEKKDDVVIWKNETTKECIVSREGLSNHIKFRVEYPTITPQLDTEEMATINVHTNNTIEAVNAMKMLFEVDDYLGVTNESLHGALRGLVGTFKLEKLNSIQSEENKDLFNSTMQSVNKGTAEHPEINNFGVKLFKSVFKDFEPADEKAKQLMDSFANVVIAKKEGDAALEKQKGVSLAYQNESDAKIAQFEKESNVRIQQEKKMKIETGIAKKDAEGNITELVPDPNVRVAAEALKETKIQTYAPSGSGDNITKILSMNPTPKE